jgi:hypothetical protein
MSDATFPSRVRTDKSSFLRRSVLPIFLWAVFGAGLLIQVLSPRPKIENNSFVVPQSAVSGTENLRPADFVARAKWTQTISALLTLTGAVGLAFYYRRAIFRAIRPDTPGIGPLNSIERQSEKENRDAC